jgi:hypothetical protein
MKTETLPEAPGAGAVVLDIGGEIGAAVLYTAPDLAGEEIEVRPAGADWDGTHVAVRERRLPNGSRWAALFGSLPQGTYEARLKGMATSPTVNFHVTGGRVVNIDWDGQQRAAGPRQEVTL